MIDDSSLFRLLPCQYIPKMERDVIRISKKAAVSQADNNTRRSGCGCMFSSWLLVLIDGQAWE